MAETPSPKQKLTFHYIKNSDFRTIYASGIIGGVNIGGLINMNFFVDRTVVPRKGIAEIGADGSVTDIAEGRDAKDGVVREIPFGVVMDVETATKTIQWLEERIKMIQSTNTQIKK